jgi:hypothetical protein
VKKKALFTAAFISVLLFSAIVVTQFAKSGAATSFPTLKYTGHPIISIHSPLDNETYSSNDVPLRFTITRPEIGEMWITNWTEPSGEVLKNKLSHVSIVIDEKLYRTIEADNDLSSPFSCYENLTNLEDGAHNLIIIAYCDGLEVEIHGAWARYLPYDVSSDLIAFTVDATSPYISILSPENASYESTGYPLNFTVNEPVSQLTYSLDGQKNVTIAGNTTLANLPYGEHNVKVYATDNVGNIGSSETITFTIAEPEPEPFPTTLVVASVVTVTVISIGLLVYFKKRKR